MSRNNERKANRTAPDSLFRRLFSTPEKVIELYNATEIYSAAVRKIPIPEFYVLYTGEAPWNDKILRLSDSFDLKTDGEKIPENSMELVVKVIDLRYTEDNEILKRSSTLSGYSLLLSYVRENRKKGMSAENAIDEAVARCIREDVLADFLKNNKEVSNMILGEGVTDEEIIAVRERDARNEGIAEGEFRNNILIQKLIDAGRIDDLRRSAADEVYKKKLYEEFNL